MARNNNRIAEMLAENLKPIDSSEIRKIRSHTKLSQEEFACYFNRTAGYISRLERGTTQPKGSALVLFNVIKRKGLEAIL
jgi:DNA-binding transcriptional regulator YiaG